MGFEGMDTEAVAAVARGLSAKATVLESLTTATNNAVNQAASAWHGADGASFHAQWRSQHHRALLQAVAIVREMAAELNREVQQQQQASAGGDGSTAASLASAFTPSTSQIPGFWDTLGQSLRVLDPFDDLATKLGIPGDLFDVTAAGFYAASWQFSNDQLVEMALAKGSNFVKMSERLDELDGVTHLGSIGHVLGPVGVALGAASYVRDLQEGRGARAIYDGTMTVFSAAAMIPVPPVNVVCGGLAAAMGLGQMAYDDVPAIHQSLDRFFKSGAEIFASL